MRRRTVVLQARLIWPERNVRPPKELVAIPVRNAGCSLMPHVPDNEYYNSLLADKSALNCSRKATLKYVWKGMTRISGGSNTDDKAGGFPSRFKSASSQTCMFYKSMLFQRQTTDLYLARVMSGWITWVGGDSPGTKFATPAFVGCV